MEFDSYLDGSHSGRKPQVKQRQLGSCTESELIENVVRRVSLAHCRKLRCDAAATARAALIVRGQL